MAGNRTGGRCAGRWATAGSAIAPISDCFEARFSPSARYNSFLVTVDDVSFDDHEVNVASHARIAAIVRRAAAEPGRPAEP
jgi:hypothetical protein